MEESGLVSWRSDNCLNMMFSAIERVNLQVGIRMREEGHGHATAKEDEMEARAKKTRQRAQIARLQNHVNSQDRSRARSIN